MFLYFWLKGLNALTLMATWIESLAVIVADNTKSVLLHRPTVLVFLVTSAKTSIWFSAKDQTGLASFG